VIYFLTFLTIPISHFSSLLFNPQTTEEEEEEDADEDSEEEKEHSSTSIKKRSGRRSPLFGVLVLFHFLHEASMFFLSAYFCLTFQLKPCLGPPLIFKIIYIMYKLLI